MCKVSPQLIELTPNQHKFESIKVSLYHCLLKNGKGVTTGRSIVSSIGFELKKIPEWCLVHVDKCSQYSSSSLPISYTMYLSNRMTDAV